MIRLAHVGAWGGRGNYGDYAIKVGVQDTVERLAANAGLDIEWRWIDIQETEFTDGYTRALHQAVDGVILGGGGLFWQRPRTAGPSGWQWKIENRVLRDWNLPLVVWSVGWPAFPHHDPTGWHRGMGESLSLLRDKADEFSVRNALTARNLTKHGFGATNDVPIVPCPAGLHMVEKPARDPDAPPVIGVVWGSDNPSMRWGTIENGEAFARSFVMQLATAARRSDARVRLIEHIDGLDTEIADLFQSFLGPRFERDRYIHPPNREALHSLVRSHAECSIVFSMRKHGIILPAAAGVYPVGLGDVPEIAATAGQWGGMGITSKGIAGHAFELAFERAGTMPILWPHLNRKQELWEHRMTRWLKGIAS